ncbi:hypothetical protein DSO57_1007008 [Entomophthora muscae]|uniref:Uncharacterized protein n=1 Tax=Entomophthora muscae TaxID=34485 RepID=A0ACC2UTD6_9FUNG|nr:hypothetical protein DSO57_1007008 [Entomophthora muscae]
MCPYYFLPDIFKHLGFDYQLRLRLVSKEWNIFLPPFVFSKTSGYIIGKHEGLLHNYGRFIRELEIYKLDARMTDLLSACKNTTRRTISLEGISPEAALILGEKFPRLSYLELIYGDPDKLSYLSPLTRKVQTLKYHFNARGGTKSFLTYYSFFDCPLVTHLIIEEESDSAEPDFSDIIMKFPALEIFDYTNHGYDGDLINSFIYDLKTWSLKNRLSRRF